MAASPSIESDVSKSHTLLVIGDYVSKFQVEAQNLLGECYELSESSDLFEAAKWYSKASKSGHARATFNLASLYETGQGVEKDFKKAVQLYKEAISRGSTEAQLRIDELQELDLLEI